MRIEVRVLFSQNRVLKMPNYDKTLQTCGSFVPQKCTNDPKVLTIIYLKLFILSYSS